MTTVTLARIKRGASARYANSHHRAPEYSTCLKAKIPTQIEAPMIDAIVAIAKLKQGGGHGGHNGLRDIISKLGNNKEFSRLRIGIGHPGSADKVSGFVLGKAPAKEQQYIDDAIDEALRIMPDLLGGNANKAMNRLHSFNASS